MKKSIIVLACVVALSSSVHADEENHTFRVLGFFQEDRVDDLKKVVETIPNVSLVDVDYQKAHATFRFDAQSLYGSNAKKPEKLASAFDRTLRQASRNTFQALPPESVDYKKLQEVKIGIRGLDCKGCSFGVYRVVYQLNGVQRATANFHDGYVKVWIHPKKTTPQSIEDALIKKKVPLDK